MGFLNFIKKLLGIRPKKKRSYGLLKFKYNKNIKLRKATQQKAIKDYNRYIKNYYNKHKKFPNRYWLGRIVRGASHETIEYKKSKTGHWPRQWLRKYIYGLHGIKYTMR